MTERPKELIYALDERPPWPQLIALGLQHVAVICPYLVMVALVVNAAGLPRAVARSAMALSMIAVAFMTILQSLRLGPIGSGYLCPPVVSAIYLPTAMSLAARSGFAAVCGMVVMAGATEIAVASLVRRMRKLFPAVVSGVVIAAVGIELGKIAVGILAKNVTSHAGNTRGMMLTAAASLATMTTLAVWGTGLPKLLCSLLGIAVGYVVGALFGVFPAGFAAELSATPFFAIPDPGFLSYSFDPSFIIPFAIAGLASGLRVVGVLTTCQQMNDATWKRPDMRNIQAGVVADGLGCLVGGLLGATGLSASPSLVGIEKTTGATSRVIVWSIAAWLLALACLPKLASVIVGMPHAVMAAALFFNGSLMFVAGIQIIASRPITLRASLVIGFSILAAVSVPIYPDFYRELPEWLHPFTSSIISMTVVAATALNALFLLGSWRYSQLHLDSDDTPLSAQKFDDFFRARAKEWLIPAEEAKRVRAVVDEAIERVSALAQGAVKIHLASDGFDVIAHLHYEGSLPALPEARPQREMVEEQAFVSGLTGYLSGLHADQIEQAAKGDDCKITLLFRL